MPLLIAALFLLLTACAAPGVHVLNADATTSAVELSGVVSEGPAAQPAEPGTCRELGGGWTFRDHANGTEVGLAYHGGPVGGLTYEESLEARERNGWPEERFQQLGWYRLEFRVAQMAGFEGDADGLARLQQDLDRRLAAAPSCGVPGEAHPLAVDPTP